MPKKKNNRKLPNYIREQGSKNAIGNKQRNITFSFNKHIKAEGESIEEWQEQGLLGKLIIRMKHIGQHSVHEVRQKKWIKEYNKHTFPPESKFKEPKHISNITWAVMHITDNSKEVVVGYIEDDVFYIVFLDKDHKFWPSKKKNT